MRKIAVYLPQVEKFSPTQGGALATWTSQVYSRLVPEYEVVVVGPPGEDDYSTLPKVDCRSNTITLVTDRLYEAIRYRSFKGLLDYPKKRWRTAYQRHAAEIIQRLAPGIVHVHNDAEAVAPIKRAIPSATVILHMNNDHLVEDYFLKTGVSKTSVDHADRIVCCSRYIENNIRAHFPEIPDSVISVIHNGADISDQVQEVGVPSKANFLPTGPNLLFIGRLVPEKGIHLLIEAFASVKQEFPKATLNVVGGIWFGDGSENAYVKRLHSLAAPFGDSVVFTGPVSHAIIKNYLATADLFVCPSVWEDPFPLVNLEAMGAGLPVVAFRRGGIPEAIGDAGILVDVISAEALSTAILGLLRDPAGCSRLGQAAYLRAREQFSWTVIAERWKRQLESIFAGRIS